MLFIQSLKKLEESKEFQDFKNKHKSAFLFSAFFIINAETLEVEAQQFNFYIPEKQESVTFMIEESIKHKIEKFMKKEVAKLDTGIKIDLDALGDIIKKETKKQKLKPAKIIAVLQRAKISSEEQKEHEQKDIQIWNATCLCNLKMLRMHVDCITGEIFKSEQINIMDMVHVKKS